MEVPDTIGIDFDNTLICYDRLIDQLVSELGWLKGVTGKRAVRDALRASPLGDEAWQQIQGMIYGLRIHEAEPAPGVPEFLSACHRHGVRVKIISHKSHFAVADPSRTPLRTAALSWMTQQGYFNQFSVCHEDIHFADTKAEKLALIRVAGVPLFIDDLEEVLTDPDFPEHVDRILYRPSGSIPIAGLTVHRHFDDIRRHLFGH